MSSIEADHLWRAASSSFAKNASGEINAFTAGTAFDRQKVFYGLELKQLIKNQNTTMPVKYW